MIWQEETQSDQPETTLMSYSILVPSASTRVSPSILRPAASSAALAASTSRLTQVPESIVDCTFQLLWASLMPVASAGWVYSYLATATICSRSIAMLMALRTSTLSNGAFVVL